MRKLVSKSRDLRLFIIWAALAAMTPLPRLQAQKPEATRPPYVFRSEVDLLSVPVRVTDRKDNEIFGLKADDFTLYEDGRRQRIAFFDAADEPISLGILLDVSGSMASSGKLEQAKDALFRIIGTMRPTDEMFYLWFHLEVGKAVGFTSDPYKLVAAVSLTPVTVDGTSLYDAIARGICYMRKARHRRQALLVLTDGADQNSHRALSELIPIVQASQAQVFIVGCLGEGEYELFRLTRHEKVPLVSRQEIDNPLTAFRQLAKESGAEAFFPASRGKIQEAVNTVAHQLRTQYTLAYYPTVKGEGFHRIEVKVARYAARVRVRRGFARPAPEAGQGPPQAASGCEDEKLRPYPYEAKMATGKNGCMVYREDFLDPASGWPAKPGYHYQSGRYEIVNAKAVPELPTGYDPLDYQHIAWGAGRPSGEAAERSPDRSALEGLVVANGPLFGDLNASVTVAWKEGGTRSAPAAVPWYELVPARTNPGLVFHLDHRGYYAVLIARHPRNSRVLAFKLVKKYHSEQMVRELTRWKDLPLWERIPHKEETIEVRCRGPVITVIFQGAPVARIEDSDFEEGIVGMILFGEGRATFRDLQAEEVCVSGRALPGVRTEAGCQPPLAPP